MAVVVRGGNTDQVARAIFRAKAPGIGTYGSTTREVVQADWNQILSCMTSGVQYVIE